MPQLPLTVEDVLAKKIGKYIRLWLKGSAVGALPDFEAVYMGSWSTTEGTWLILQGDTANSLAIPVREVILFKEANEL